MRINLAKNKLIITFKYSPHILPALRSIPGRQFNVNKKHWEVPVENASECLDILIPLGFTPTLEVKELADAQRRQVERAVEIRGQAANYTGTLPLFEFQKIGYRFLKEMPHALLADVPGLGKTIQTIAALENSNRVLVLCPNSLKFSWLSEIEKFCPEENALVIDGEKEKRDHAWQQSSSGVSPGFKYYIANYEVLLRDWDRIPKEWDVIVCDEATRISNPSAKTTKALKKLQAGKRIALTGTPISNKPDDIWSIIDWISPRYLGSYYQFTEEYCIKEPRFNRIVGYRNLTDLGNRVARFMLRRTKEEVLKDLPAKTLENIEFELSEKERKLYTSIKNLIIAEIAQLDVAKHTLQLIPVKMLRLKQVTDHPVLVKNPAPCESSKLEALKDILRPIMASKEKAIVFTQFAEMAKVLLSELNIYNPRLIIGEVDAPDRQKAVEEFTNDPEALVMIMTEAGAYGLNLQAASYVVHYDLPWSVAKLQQREDRAHRIGQTKPVTVYTLTAKNTIDEYVAKVLRRKQKVSVDILKDAERLEDVGLSEEDIKAILRI